MVDTTKQTPDLHQTPSTAKRIYVTNFKLDQEERREAKMFKGKTADQAASMIIDMYKKQITLEKEYRVTDPTLSFRISDAKKAANSLYKNFDDVILSNIKKEADKLVKENNMQEVSYFLRHTIFVEFGAYDKAKLRALHKIYFDSEAKYIKQLIDQQKLGVAREELKTAMIYAHFDAKPEDVQWDVFVELSKKVPREVNTGAQSRGASTNGKYQNIDLYQSLGVDVSATQDEIRSAFRKLSRKYHPDLQDPEASEEKFKEIGLAYEILGNPKKRRRYNEMGVEGTKDPAKAYQAKNTVKESKDASEINRHFSNANQLINDGKLNEAEEEYKKVYEINLKYEDEAGMLGALATIRGMWSYAAKMRAKERKYNTAKRYLEHGIDTLEHFGYTQGRDWLTNQLEKLKEEEVEYKHSFRGRFSKPS